MAEADWTRICGHTSYRVDNGVITLRAEAGKSLINAHVGKMYLTLPKEHSETLLKIRLHSEETFGTLIAAIGHILKEQLVQNSLVTYLCLDVNPTLATLAVNMAREMTVTNSKLLLDMAKCVSISEEEKAKFVEEGARLRKLIGEDEED